MIRFHLLVYILITLLVVVMLNTGCSNTLQSGNKQPEYRSNDNAKELLLESYKNSYERNIVHVEDELGNSSAIVLADIDSEIEQIIYNVEITNISRLSNTDIVLNGIIDFSNEDINKSDYKYLLDDESVSEAYVNIGVNSELNMITYLEISGTEYKKYITLEIDG